MTSLEFGDFDIESFTTWMSRDGSDRINGLFHLLINGVIVGVITH